MRRLSVRAGLTCLAGAIIAVLTGLSACGQASGPIPIVEGGDPRRGKAAIRNYGCGSCHTMPGIPGANGNVGPPLIDMARQVYLAGILPNQPDNMVRWIRSPQEVNPRTAMPDMGVTEADARDIAAYLYAPHER